MRRLFSSISIFMLVGAMNFGLHFTAWRSGRFGAYRRDPECSAFLRLMLGLSALTLVYLLLAGDYDDTLRLAADGIFQAVEDYRHTYLEYLEEVTGAGP